MKQHSTNKTVTNNCQDEAEFTSKEQTLASLESQISALATMSDSKGKLMLDCATLYLYFQRTTDAWDYAWQAFEYFVASKNWQLAVVACDIMVASGQKDSLKALAHGVWLGITYPIHSETTVGILQHLIDESPVGSDTAAVAAVSAHYIADIRKSSGKAGDNLLFLTQQTLGKVAAEHRNISNQEEFDIWVTGNEFDNPESFLPKLSIAMDALVKDEWWFDRNKLRSEIF